LRFFRGAKDDYQEKVPIMTTTRRQILKGVSLGASGFILSPLVDQLVAHAEGAAGQTQRFVFVVKSSGLTPGELVPRGMTSELLDIGEAVKSGDNYATGKKLKPADKLLNRSLAGQELPVSLAPLAPFKDRMMILQGLSGNMVKGGHTSGYGAMSCVKGNGGSNGSGTPTAETIDSIMARKFPAVFSHLGLSTVTRTMGSGSADSVCYPGISAAGPGKALPFQGSPTQAYRTLFGSVASGSARKKFDLRSNVLDMMASDVRQLQKQVSAPEREKLTFHVEAIEDLQRRRVAIAKMSDQIRKGAPVVTENFTSTEVIDRLDAHFDLAAGALISGLTNVITIRPDGLGTPYTGLGINAVNVHGIGHGVAPEGFESPDEARSAIRKYHLQQVAKLAAKLRAVPEGSGTMLDNTTIIYFSDVGDKHHASNREWPYIVIGDVGGKLKTTGRYVQYPGKGNAGHHTIANWWMTLLHATSQPQDEFGMKDSNVAAAAQKGPLVEFLA
jgi:hypothetical protein